MARSKRKPFVYWGGRDRSHSDKRAASKADRSQKKRWLQQFHGGNDYDDTLIPHRFETHSNDVWIWQRDGRATYFRRPDVDEARHGRWLEVQRK